ncbi:ANK_REP_REGION domain-containing protein [Nephila pilipes]|uniref:Alpha-latrotoxin n=1 Tax=Nephila pilipes TaxID=299642 RepID=A0A8X6N8L8_NEPPI|nr:ANK_REP_REGION domain-containing protein [Nephila pilipes]
MLFVMCLTREVRKLLDATGLIATAVADINENCNSQRKSNRLRKFTKEAVPGDTELHEYCRAGRHADLLQAMFTNSSLDINSKNSAGNTPLHLACLVNSFHCMKFLLEEAGDQTVDFKATDIEGRTPLHCAVYVNALDIAKMLLKKGGEQIQ